MMYIIISQYMCNMFPKVLHERVCLGICVAKLALYTRQLSAVQLMRSLLEV